MLLRALQKGVLYWFLECVVTYVLLCPRLVAYIPQNILKTIKLLLKMLHLHLATLYSTIYLNYPNDQLFILSKKIPLWAAHVWLGATLKSSALDCGDISLKQFHFLNVYGFLYDTGWLWHSNMHSRIHHVNKIKTLACWWFLIHVIKNLLLFFMLFEETNRNFSYSHMQYM